MRVLIVDDEPTVRDALARTLERRGAAVMVSHGVVDAIKRLQKHCFDLVLTDFHLGDGDGEEVMKEAMTRCPDGKVALMSGNLQSIPALIKKYAHVVFEKPDVLFAADQLFDLCQPSTG